MNQIIETSTPGKALILGEYAVLEGYPAIVQGLTRRARVQLAPADSHTITALPLLDQPLSFYFDDNQQFQWRQADHQQRLPFIALLMRALGEWEHTPKHSWSLTLDTRDFFSGDGDKLGLGSSAALTVALAATWYRQRNPGQTFDQQRWLSLLVKLHQQLQDGRGSGADVAASIYGGLIEYRITDNDCVVQQLQWPASIECIWIWIGHSASTSEFLGRMSDFKLHNPTQYARHMAYLGELSLTGVKAFANGSAGDCLQSIADYGQAMQALGEVADAQIYTDDHRRLAQLARQYGVAFKPSGAGGGDIAMAAAADTNQLAQFANQVQVAGYGLLELAPAEQGVEINSSRSSATGISSGFVSKKPI